MSAGGIVTLGILMWMVSAPTLASATLSPRGVNLDDGKGGNECLKDGGDSICPIGDIDYSSDGVFGAVVDDDASLDGKGTLHLLYHFFNDKDGYAGCTSSEECRSLCISWPYTPTGFKLTPTNGHNGICAHWSWNGNSDCYLFGCGVCDSATSFSTNAKFRLKRFVSGGGPGMRYCTSGVKGDPHFHGADDSDFDFTGIPGTNYCLISDSHVHVNAFYGGRYDRWGNETSKPLTWIRRVAIMWGHHTVKLVAREGARWEYGQGYLGAMEVDGDPVSLSQEGDSLSLVDGTVHVKWIAAKRRDGNDMVDVYEVNVGNVLLTRLTLRPEVEVLRTPMDGVVHFDIEFPMADLSDDVHGVLGQTYRSDHEDRKSKQVLEYNDVLGVNMVKGQNAEGFLDGNVGDYASSDLMKADCKMSRFTRATVREDEASRAMASSSASSSSLPRKALGFDGILAI